MASTPDTTFTISRLDPVYPGHAETLAVAFGASLTLVQGTVVGQKTSDGLYYPYASGNSDGTQIPKGLTEYAIATDANGKVTYGGTATGGWIGDTYLLAQIWVRGQFKTSELVQSGAGAIDANAVAVLQGAYLSGVLADGILRIG